MRGKPRGTSLLLKILLGILNNVNFYFFQSWLNLKE